MSHMYSSWQAQLFACIVLKTATTIKASTGMLKHTRDFIVMHHSLAQNYKFMCVGTAHCTKFAALLCNLESLQGVLMALFAMALQKSLLSTGVCAHSYVHTTHL